MRRTVVRRKHSKRFNTPTEACEFHPGATLKKAEVLEILNTSIEAAKTPRSRSCPAPTRSNPTITSANGKEVFGLLGWEIDDSPCPADRGTRERGRRDDRKTDDSPVDRSSSRARSWSSTTIGVYKKNLIINADAMERQDVVAALQRNIRSEQSALEKVGSLQADARADRELDRAGFTASASDLSHL